jgi:hypothetical protein
LFGGGGTGQSGAAAKVKRERPGSQLFGGGGAGQRGAAAKVATTAAATAALRLASRVGGGGSEVDVHNNCQKTYLAEPGQGGIGLQQAQTAEQGAVFEDVSIGWFDVVKEASKAQIARAIVEGRLNDVKRVYSKYLNQYEITGAVKANRDAAQQPVALPAPAPQEQQPQQQAMRQASQQASQQASSQTASSHQEESQSRRPAACDLVGSCTVVAIDDEGAPAQSRGRATY